MDAAGATSETQHDIPPPPRVAGDNAHSSFDASSIADPFAVEEPPLRPGQLAPGWKTLFIAGWAGVVIGFGCIWQAARVAGIAPWWLGPPTNPRSFLVIALPFIAPLVTLAVAAVNSRWSVYVGLVAGVAAMCISLGDLDQHAGLAAGQAAIGAAGLLVTVACFAGRMRRPKPTQDVSAS